VENCVARVIEAICVGVGVWAVAWGCRVLWLVVKSGVNIGGLEHD